MDAYLNGLNGCKVTFAAKKYNSDHRVEIQGEIYKLIRLQELCKKEKDVLR